MGPPNGGCCDGCMTGCGIDVGGASDDELGLIRLTAECDIGGWCMGGDAWIRSGGVAVLGVGGLDVFGAGLFSSGGFGPIIIGCDWDDTGG